MKNAGLRGRISVNNFNSQGAIVLLLLSPVLFNGRPSLLCSPSEWTCFARLRFQEEKFSAPIKRNTHRSLPAQSDSSPSIHSNSSSSYSYSLSITMSDPTQVAGKRKRSSTSIPHPMIAEPFFSVAQFSGPLDFLLFTHSPYPFPGLALPAFYS